MDQAGDSDPAAIAAAGREAAIGKIRAMEDHRAAYQAAVRLLDDQLAGKGEAARLKREMLRRVWKAEEASLAVLAQFTRTSRQKVSKLLQDTEDGDD